jgi:hypothetical protein
VVFEAQERAELLAHPHMVEGQLDVHRGCLVAREGELMNHLRALHAKMLKGLLHVQPVKVDLLPPAPILGDHEH